MGVKKERKQQQKHPKQCLEKEEKRISTK